MRDVAYQPLSRRQKADLCILARRAYGNRPDDPGFDLWRHEQAIRACGRRISAATQRDWAPLLAHFQVLCGRPEQAMDTLIHAEGNPRRIAMHKLGRECVRCHLAMSYVAAICRKQYRCELADASAKQLWCLIFTVRNRGNRRKRSHP